MNGGPVLVNQVDVLLFNRYRLPVFPPRRILSPALLTDTSLDGRN